MSDTDERIVTVLHDPMWGPLTINPGLLLDDLQRAQQALGLATGASQYRTNEGGRINSRWAELIGGVSQVLDSLISEIQERWPDV